MPRIIEDDDSEEMQIDTRAKLDVVHDLPKPVDRNTITAPNRSVANSHIPSSIVFKTQNQSSAARPEYVRQLQETITMANQKKVNAANAFEIDINCLDNIKDFIMQQKDGNKWIRSGEAIDAGAKIYGFRVDNVHTETYRMLNGMTRNATGEEEIVIVGAGNESDEDKDQNQNNEQRADASEDKKKKIRRIKFAENQGEKTLEKLSNLNMSVSDSATDFDPLFRKTTQMFDKMTHWSRLVGTLAVSPNLLMQLDSRSSNIAKESFDDHKRRSGERQEPFEDFCGNLSKDICNAKLLIK